MFKVALNYFYDRTARRERLSLLMTTDVLKGSILGYPLCIPVHDNSFNLRKLPSNVDLIVYAHELAVTVRPCWQKLHEALINEVLMNVY